MRAFVHALAAAPIGMALAWVAIAVLWPHTYVEDAMTAILLSGAGAAVAVGGVQWWRWYRP
jgi:hypothetical protein